MRQRLTVGLEDSTAPYKPHNFKLDGAVAAVDRLIASHSSDRYEVAGSKTNRGR